MALGHSDGSPEEPESDSDDYVPSEYDVNSDDEPPEEGPGDLIDVSSDKLVQKTLVQPGHGFRRPGRYDAVRVTYRGVYENGEVWEEATDRELQLGDQSIPYGFEILLRSMRPEETCTSTLPKSYMVTSRL